MKGCTLCLFSLPWKGVNRMLSLLSPKLMSAIQKGYVSGSRLAVLMKTAEENLHRRVGIPVDRSGGGLWVQMQRLLTDMANGDASLLKNIPVLLTGLACSRWWASVHGCSSYKNILVHLFSLLMVFCAALNTPVCGLLDWVFFRHRGSLTRVQEYRLERFGCTHKRMCTYCLIH